MEQQTEIQHQKQKRPSEPLISIIVITYNSAKYILETLESARSQTYQNVELIISDDCSTDNTEDICKKWIEENEKRFVKTTFITIEKNTGISANCNRGINVSQGEWIKLIAGDDVLIDTCIEDCIKFVMLSKEDINVLIGAGISFICKPVIPYLNEVIYNNPFYKPELSSVQQYKLLLKSNRIFTPACFIKRELLIKLNGYNEDYKNLEDYPLYLKITKAGYKIYGLPKPLVYYRLRTDSVFSSQFINEKNKIVKESYWSSLKFSKEIIYPELNFLGKLAFQQTYFRNRLLKKCGNSWGKFSCKVVIFFFTIFSVSRLEEFASSISRK